MIEQQGLSRAKKVSTTQCKLSIHCGCGFLARTLKEATEHAEKAKHVLSIHGQLGPIERMVGAEVIHVG